MKRLGTALIVAVLPLLPASAWAGSSTDAALGLGAFAVFNQILGGTGIFAGLVPARPVYVAPRPVYVAPRPVIVYRSAGPAHGHAKHWGHR